MDSVTLKIWLTFKTGTWSWEGKCWQQGKGRGNRCDQNTLSIYLKFWNINKILLKLKEKKVSIVRNKEKIAWHNACHLKRMSPVLPRLEFPKTWLQMLLFYIHPTSVAVPHRNLLISESSQAEPHLPKVQGYLFLSLSGSLESGHGKTPDNFQRNEKIKSQKCIPVNLEQMASAKERAFAKALVSLYNHTFSSSHSTCALRLCAWDISVQKVSPGHDNSLIVSVPLLPSHSVALQCFCW